jgi:uncharacterized coiled-coil protein SlyX
MFARDRGQSAQRRRLDSLEARLERVEAALEDLQDALYRQAVAHDKQLGELRARTKPHQIARDLSEDARKRGL